MTSMAAQGGSGVAGAIARASDVVSDGCAECPRATGSVQIWNLEAPFEQRSQASERVAARSPDLTLEASGSYRQALDTGWYLLCARPSCIELNVHPEETLTVNIEFRDGPTSFFVGGPGTAPLVEDFGFDVGY